MALIKTIQDYLKSKTLADIRYVVCREEIMLPYSESLMAYLSDYTPLPLGKKLVVANHGLPDYYTAYAIKADKRTKAQRVLSMTVVYKIGDCIISLIGGQVVVYPKGGALIDIGEDNPETRETAYTVSLMYGKVL